MFYIRFQELMHITFPTYFGDPDRQPLEDAIQVCMDPKQRGRRGKRKYVTAHSRYYAFRPVIESF